MFHNQFWWANEPVWLHSFPIFKIDFLVLLEIVILSTHTSYKIYWSPDSSLLLVFSVTPFKIDQNKNQNRSIDKVQNLGNERRYIYKDPRQDSGQRNISYTRYPKKCFTQTYRDLYETPCWCSPGWAPTWRTETNRNICYRVLLQKREFVLRETHKH